MSISYKVVLYSHIIVGFLSLILFWIPVMAKKGSAWHARCGHWYAKCMYSVGISAMILSAMSLIDPLAFKFANHSFSAGELVKIIANQRDTGLFLMAISLLTVVGVHHGLQTIASKKDHAQMRNARNLGSNILLLGFGGVLAYSATGNSPMSVLFYVFAGLCSYTAVVNLRYCLRSDVTPGQRIIAHLTSIIGAGIGSHTAFFLFGASRLMAGVFTGYLALVPWILPSVVGFVLIAKQARKYRPKKPAVKATIANNAKPA